MYTPEHNDRFAVVPASDVDFHTPVPAGLDLDTIFRLEETRTLTNDWVARYGSRYLQIKRHGRHYPPAQSTVQVCEYEDGHLDVLYRGRAVPWTEIAAPRRSVPAPADVAADAPLPLSRPRHRNAANHPWQGGYKQLIGNMPWSG